MKCLTETECSEWLKHHAIIEAPYNCNSAPIKADYARFVSPKTTTRLIAFTRHFFDWVGDFEFGLLQMTDWSLHEPDEMAIVNSIRRSHGETRWLIKAPGHLFDQKGRDELISMFYLSIMFGWTTYLYFLPNKVTVLNWEGDIIDLWAFDSKHFAEFSQIKETFQLQDPAKKK